jgi:hypothetical protein
MECYAVLSISIAPGGMRKCMYYVGSLDTLKGYLAEDLTQSMSMTELQYGEDISLHIVDRQGNTLETIPLGITVQIEYRGLKTSHTLISDEPLGWDLDLDPDFDAIDEPEADCSDPSRPSMTFIDDDGEVINVQFIIDWDVKYHILEPTSPIAFEGMTLNPGPTDMESGID